MPAVAVRSSQRNRLLKQLSSPRVNVERLAGAVIKQPASIPAIINAVDSSSARGRFAAAKVLRLVSERAPHRLYRHYEALLAILDSDNAILRWNAIQIIANLAPVDHQERIERMLDRFLHPIYEDEMIGAANCVQAGARIAVAKPHLADRIAQHILSVEHAVYKTPECRNVAIGHAIVALDQFLREIRKQDDVIAFVRRQLSNSRSGTKKKAEAFLRKWVA
jgi:hypothetical protein